MSISPEIKEKAKMADDDVLQRIKTLEKFGVVGFEKQPQFLETKQFLKENNVEFEFNQRFLIWLPELSDNLKKTFRG